VREDAVPGVAPVAGAGSMVCIRRVAFRRARLAAIRCMVGDRFEGGAVHVAFSGSVRLPGRVQEQVPREDAADALHLSKAQGAAVKRRLVRCRAAGFQ